MTDMVNPATKSGGERLYHHHICFRVSSSFRDPEIFCQMAIDRKEPFTSIEELGNWMESKGFDGQKLYCGPCGTYSGDLLIGFCVFPNKSLAYQGVSNAGSVNITSTAFNDVVI